MRRQKREERLECLAQFKLLLPATTRATLVARVPVGLDKTFRISLATAATAAAIRLGRFLYQRLALELGVREMSERANSPVQLSDFRARWVRKEQGKNSFGCYTLGSIITLGMQILKQIKPTSVGGKANMVLCLSLSLSPARSLSFTLNCTRIWINRDADELLVVLIYRIRFDV